jgi:hypothetical protein
MSKRRWSDDQLRHAVAACVTKSDVLRSLGLSVSPGNYANISCHIRRLHLSTLHFVGKAHGRSVDPKKRPTSSLLVENASGTGGPTLRRRLIREGLLEERCVMCGLGPVWNDEPLTLQMDHVNGCPTDNRLLNLRILCPNCHSQTKNFAGNALKGRYSRPKNRCVDCGNPIFRSSTRCAKCDGGRHQKIVWPPADVLAIEVSMTSYRAVAKRLGMSDNAVKKYLLSRLGHAPRKRQPKVPRAGVAPASPR